MRKRLEMLLNEQFEYETVRMQLSGRTVDLTARAGEKKVRGAFLVTCPGEGKMRGFLHASNPRIQLAGSGEFYGHENPVLFEVGTEGLAPGEKAQGEISVSSDLGEETVFVTVTMEEAERTEEPDMGRLTDLARTDFGRAASLFASEGFRKQMRLASDPDLGLCNGLEGEENPARRLEEFLVGTGRKEAVDLTGDWTFKKIKDPEGTVRESLTLTASSWGYLEVEIKSDAHFLRPERDRLTTADFIGDRYDLGLIIDSNLLHAGRNFGKVTLRTPYRTLEVLVRADRTSDPEKRRQAYIRKLMRKKLVFLYLDYRMGKTDLHNWTGRTQSVLRAYQRAGGRDVYADLFSIFVLQADGKRREAERGLAALQRTPQRLASPDSYAFFLFLSTFFTRDQEEISLVRAEVRRLAEAYPNDWRIRWVCLYLLEDDPAGEEGRLNTVLTMIERGCNSPIFYLEGALCLRKDPFLFRHLTPAMRLVLNFAAKMDLLPDRIYLALAEEEKRNPSFDPVLFRLLERYADKAPAKELLEGLCAMAIAGGKKDPSFFPLYRAAVTRDASVVGLYEYYMETMDVGRIETMPEVIRRYFVYNDTMSYAKKAGIYRNMADRKRQIPGIFRDLRTAIERFVIDQVAQGHLNHDLAALYREFLTGDMLTDKLAEKLLTLLFTYRIDCLSPSMRKIILTDSRLEKETVVPIQGTGALVQIYSDRTRILLEDGEGRRYASTSLYMADHILDSQRLLDLCAARAGRSRALTLLYTLNTGKDQPVSEQNRAFFQRAAGMRILTEDYREKIRGWLLDFYADHPKDPSLEDFLRTISLREYGPCRPQTLQGLLVGAGFYEKAYQMVLSCGADQVPASLLVRICSQMVLAEEYEEQAPLLDACAWCFFSGKMDQNTLAYLALYYEGTVSNMMAVWTRARQYGLDTIRLEKKILALILFEREGEEGSEAVYESYRKALGNHLLLKAYPIFMSYQYLIRTKKVGASVFDEMTRAASCGETLPSICSLALLRYLSAREDRTEEENAVCRKLLETFENRNIRLAFFADFPESFHAAAGIREKVFFQMTASPESRVTLFYRRRGSGASYTQEEMKDLAFGIRVREFLLFGGEELECFTEEERADKTRILSGVQVLKSRPLAPGQKETRYGKLCALSSALGAGRMEEARQDLLEIRQTDALIDQLFPLI